MASQGCKWGHKQCQIHHPAPLSKLSEQSRQADTFQDFPTSLMSVGKTSDDGMVLVFTKEGINVFKEEDVLITCKREPILIGIRDNQGWYWIPLMQQRGHWQPWCPSKQAWKALWQANSVYNLPSTKQAIKWMHAICGYPIKLTWLKAINVGNYVGSPMLTEHNVQRGWLFVHCVGLYYSNWILFLVMFLQVPSIDSVFSAYVGFIGDWLFSPSYWFYVFLHTLG